MSKSLAIAIATTLLLTSSPLFAQSIDLGPGGPRIDLRGPGEREREREIRHEREERMREEGRREERRREGRFEGDRGDGRCRVVEIRERDDNGDMVIRRRRECRD